MELAQWIKSVKEGMKGDELSLLVLCLITGTHVFVHLTSNDYWTSLKERPSTHLEFTQGCNLHMSYMGRGLYAEHVMRTEIVDYAIFSVDEPVSLDVSTELIVIGRLTAEDHTLDILLKTSVQKDNESNTIQTASSALTRIEGPEHPDLREFDKLERCEEGACSFSEDPIDVVNLDSSTNDGPNESAINEHNITRPSDNNTGYLQ